MLNDMAQGLTASQPGALPRATLRGYAARDYVIRVPLPASRPKYCVLEKGRIQRAFGIEMPNWTGEVQGCLSEITADPG